jgi:hypothetical protein
MRGLKSSSTSIVFKRLPAENLQSTGDNFSIVSQRMTRDIQQGYWCFFPHTVFSIMFGTLNADNAEMWRFHASLTSRFEVINNTLPKLQHAQYRPHT